VTSPFTTSTIDATHMPVTWRQVNSGLVTHLPYGIASGDPVLGNQRFAFMGLQDNGTRFRNGGNDTRWNQVVGGDGVGTAISIHPDGSHQVFFQSLPGRREFCRPGETFFIPGSFDPAIHIDCNSGLLHPNQGPDNLNTEFTTWNTATNPNLPNGDSEPFLQRYSAVGDANGSLMTITSQYAWKINVDDSDNVTYTLISNLFASRIGSTVTARSSRGMIFVTPWTYDIGFPEPSRLYGVPLSGGFFYVGVENSFDPNNGVLQPWTWNSSQSALGSTGAGGALQQMSSTSSIAFPHNPVNLGGTVPQQPKDLLNTYIVSSVTPLDLTNNLIRDDVGRIFKTTNNGASWTSIAPVSSGMPNVPVDIVRFDPGDPTDQTIYAGTDIGMYRTTDGGAHWSRYGFGLPMVRITDISFASNGSLIRVATYGRGVWEIYPHDQAPVAAGTPDWDMNGQVDFLDLAAMASRLGTAPGDGSNKYESTIDTDQSGVLDDSDLTTLLGQYGNGSN
jgi:hypothetical protein